MPYQTTWVDPELFVTISLDDGRSVSVYHTYARDDMSQGVNMWRFTLDPTSDECDRIDIDLRIMDRRIRSADSFHVDKELYVEVLKDAIANGKIEIPTKNKRRGSQRLNIQIG
jgi:hypothetical protein